MTRVQWKTILVIHGQPANEVTPEGMPEQIQPW